MPTGASDQHERQTGQMEILQESHDSHQSGVRGRVGEGQAQMKRDFELGPEPWEGAMRQPGWLRSKPIADEALFITEDDAAFKGEGVGEWSGD